jgi:translocator protein
MIPAWLVIGGVAVLVGVGLNKLIKSDQRWFFRLRRPAWLTFEGLIPLIWTTIFIAAAWSAYVVWQAAPGTPQTWLLMAGYLLLEIVTLCYTPVMCLFRRLRIGTIIGATGFLIGLVLSLFVAGVSSLGFWLLVPYLLWSPIGTFVTWQMQKINPGAA